MKSERVYLQHMLEAIALIEGYIEEKSFEDLLNAPLLQDGLVRQLTIIGEAARRVSTSFKEAHPEIPWGSIVGQRNVLAHEYGEVLIERIWLVAINRIPELIQLLDPLIPPPPESDE